MGQRGADGRRRRDRHPLYRHRQLYSSSSYQYATGYTVTADYSGEVAKPDCDVVTYTAIFGSTEAPEGSEAPGTEQGEGSESTKAAVDLSALKMPLLVGGVVAALAAGGVFAFKKIKERR